MSGEEDWMHNSRISKSNKQLGIGQKSWNWTWGWKKIIAKDELDIEQKQKASHSETGQK